METSHETFSRLQALEQRLRMMGAERFGANADEGAARSGAFEPTKAGE
jgi:hypothetical protein